MRFALGSDLRLLNVLSRIWPSTAEVPERPLHLHVRPGDGPIAGPGRSERVLGSPISALMADRVPSVQLPVDLVRSRPDGRGVAHGAASRAVYATALTALCLASTGIRSSSTGVARRRTRWHADLVDRLRTGSRSGRCSSTADARRQTEDWLPREQPRRTVARRQPQSAGGDQARPPGGEHRAAGPWPTPSITTQSALGTHSSR